MSSEDEKAGAGTVSLRDRYAIFPGNPIPELSTPNTVAFQAEDKRGAGKNLFALIVRPGYPPRLNTLRSLKGVECPGLMLLEEWGVVDWPPLKRKVMVLVYDRPMGGRLADTMLDIRRLEEVDALRKLITPFAAALKVLKAQGGLTHRAIRPTNMYWATPDRDRIVLGDCAAVPPAFEQPAALETVESAMAAPNGRGAGSSADDVYAFGASLAMLLQGRNPVAGMNDEALLRQKIVMGSYGVLAGEARLPLPMIEILRGTLCDDEDERWGVEALDLWISGRRLSPLVARIEKRAARAFTLNNRDYYTARELAIAIAASWETALAQLGDGRLELWLRRSMDNKDKADLIAAVLGGPESNDRRTSIEVTVARICMVLDSLAPIRYKHLACMPDGWGNYLATTMADRGDIRTIAEAMLREVPRAYFQTRTTYNPDNSILENTFRLQKEYLDRQTIGYGIERVAYSMNEALPCLSPFTVDDYVLELRDLLPALNTYAKRADTKLPPIDRHVAAFIWARASFEVDRQISDIALPDPARSTMGLLNLFALIQWRLGQGGLYGLTTWIAGLLTPAVQLYQNREKRKELEAQIPTIAREGSIVELSRLLDSPDERANDLRGFEAARSEWFEAFRQLQDIEAGRIDLGEGALVMAQQIAALVSVTICFVTFVLLLIRKIF